LSFTVNLTKEIADPEFFAQAYPGNSKKHAQSMYNDFIAANEFNRALAYERLGDMDSAIHH
jgi:hypothetical protein